MNFDTSKRLFEQAVKVMPGGVNSPVRGLRFGWKNAAFH